MGQKIWERFHTQLQPTTPAYCKVYNVLWQDAKGPRCSVEMSRAELAAASGHDERTTRSATKWWEEREMLWVERKRIGPNKNAKNIYHLRHVWVHWFRWQPSKKTLHKRATDLGDPPYPSKREKISKSPAQRCSEKGASRPPAPTVPTRPVHPDRHPCSHPLDELCHYGDITMCQHCWTLVPVNATATTSATTEEDQAHAACDA